MYSEMERLMLTNRGRPRLTGRGYSTLTSRTALTGRAKEHFK
jgi:hypothetical protein